ncbi:hypothetical protein [Burkholderia aenigmatica]|uniref:Phage tail protein n=1 Tax=Burkholderia aenigmatica TaxID=2015348 RepID=A0A228II95_9BURK|nr:hypothetical protein [Burkholderia aenigmatica]OXI42121.1 hypothetical protein CFB84_23040 [Burkholderia aenigmatica]
MNKEQIFAAITPATHQEPIKALGGAKLRFKELSGDARESLTRNMGDDFSNARFEALVVVSTVVDDRDNPMFTLDDVAALRKSRATAISEMAAVSMRINNIGAAAEADAAKN